MAMAQVDVIAEIKLGEGGTVHVYSQNESWAENKMQTNMEILHLHRNVKVVILTNIHYWLHITNISYPPEW